MSDPKPTTPPASPPLPAATGSAPGAPAGNPPPPPAGPGNAPAAPTGNPPPPSDLRILSEDAPYQPPPRPKTRWFGYSSLLFLVACGFGYYKYRDYVEHPPPPPPKPAVELKAVPASANPLTALKQAKAIIQKAGDTHKAAYATVDAMLDAPGKKSPSGAWAAPNPAPATEPATDAAQPPAVAPTEPLTAPTAVSGAVPAITSAAPTAPSAAKPTAAPTVAPRDTPLPSMVGQDLFMPAGSAPVGQDFLRWAYDVKISGVRTGPLTRLNIDGTTYKQGDLVNRALAITFVGYDEAAHALRFRDAKGAMICFRH